MLHLEDCVETLKIWFYLAQILLWRIPLPFEGRGTINLLPLDGGGWEEVKPFLSVYLIFLLDRFLFRFSIQPLVLLLLRLHPYS